jgi:hypothetical protein
MAAEKRRGCVGKVGPSPRPAERPVVHTSKIQPSAMYLQRTLSLVKVNVDFASRASDVDYLNMVGEPQQSETGSQRWVDGSREGSVWNYAGLCIFELLLLLLFDGSDGAVGTQHLPQCVRQEGGRLPRLSQMVFVCISYHNATQSINRACTWPLQPSL